MDILPVSSDIPLMETLMDDTGCVLPKTWSSHKFISHPLEKNFLSLHLN
jgi:hypothetical protein